MEEMDAGFDTGMMRDKFEHRRLCQCHLRAVYTYDLSYQLANEQFAAHTISRMILIGGYFKLDTI
jgi:hypothetical protein